MMYSWPLLVSMLTMMDLIDGSHSTRTPVEGASDWRWLRSLLERKGGGGGDGAYPLWLGRAWRQVSRITITRTMIFAIPKFPGALAGVGDRKFRVSKAGCASCDDDEVGCIYLDLRRSASATWTPASPGLCAPRPCAGARSLFGGLHFWRPPPSQVYSITAVSSALFNIRLLNENPYSELLSQTIIFTDISASFFCILYSLVYLRLIMNHM